jgi:Leucine-rich repeat (LRR) protein
MEENMKQRIVFILVIFLTLAGSSMKVTAVPLDFNCATITDIPVMECNALVDLYNSTNGASWTNHTNWLVSTSAGDWFGVGVSTDHVVYSISLPVNNLSGTLPSSMDDLTELNSIDLSNNGIGGSLPPELGNLDHLYQLYISDNQISGSIPSALGDATNLLQLALDRNQFSGSIPPELGALTNLTELWLYTNQLTGSIPPQLGNLTHLVYFYLSNNHLSGRIPASLGNLVNATAFDVSSNHLTGNIPNSFVNLSSVSFLILGNNDLCVPPDYPNPVNPLHVFLEIKAPDWDLHQDVGICPACYLPLLRK